LRESLFKASPGKKLARLHLSKKAGHNDIWLSAQLCGRLEQEDHSLCWPKQQCKTLCKKTANVKRSGGMTQVIEHLPSNRETLSSNSGTTSKQTNKNFKGEPSYLHCLFNGSINILAFFNK
jgi:hypothetical protein